MPSALMALASSVPWMPPSRDRGADEIPEQHAEIFAVFRRLNHQNREQGVARRHPERGAHHAAPEELADAARRRRFAGIRAHREAEAEAVPGPQQIMVLPRAGVEVIARYEGERARAENAHAVNRAAEAQHGGEAGIIRKRGHEAAAAGLKFRRRRHVARVDSRRGHEVEREWVGAPGKLRLWREEGGVDHVERAE